MIHRDDPGPQPWNGVHVTHLTTVAELFDVDNVGPAGTLLAGFELFRHAGDSLDGLIRQARDAGRRVLAIGSGWALSQINITDGWLVNTKLLNGCYDIAERHFEDDYPPPDRPGVVLAQAGLQIAELNAYLELTRPHDRRALKAAGIGNGQTLAGAVSGNTHGSQITYGAMPDFVVGLHIATGRGRTLWLERASKPVLTADFAAALNADLVRDDELFDAAVVSFGTCGIIAAMAVETEPIYQLQFPPVGDLPHDELKAKLRRLSTDTGGLYHYEFIFDPFSRKQLAMDAGAERVEFRPGIPTPQPRWIVRDKHGYAPGVRILAPLAPLLRVLPVGFVTSLQFKQYRRRALLNNVRGTPGQLYTSSIYYLEGYTESAFAVSIDDAPETIDVVSAVARGLKLPSISQVRLVHPTRATLGFTHHAPKTAVFEVGLINDERFPEFERRLDAAFRQAGIRYTLHWSKNSGIDPDKLAYMYGEERIASFRRARKRIFGGDETLMATFASDVLKRAGLA
jgi:FAD/FMN-containing dehydrogenase